MTNQSAMVAPTAAVVLGLAVAVLWAPVPVPVPAPGPTGGMAA